MRGKGMKLRTEAELAYLYREKERGRMMTRRQENYIAYLMNMLGWDIDEREKFWRDKGTSPLSLTKNQASEVISDLKKRLYKR